MKGYHITLVLMGLLMFGLVSGDEETDKLKTLRNMLNQLEKKKIYSHDQLMVVNRNDRQDSEMSILKKLRDVLYYMENHKKDSDLPGDFIPKNGNITLSVKIGRTDILRTLFQIISDTLPSTISFNVTREDINMESHSAMERPQEFNTMCLDKYPNCRLFSNCPAGQHFGYDDLGCLNSCSCREPEPSCIEVNCMKQCPFGYTYLRDSKGCKLPSCMCRKCVPLKCHGGCESGYIHRTTFRDGCMSSCLCVPDTCKWKCPKKTCDNGEILLRDTAVRGCPDSQCSCYSPSNVSRNQLHLQSPMDGPSTSKPGPIRPFEPAIAHSQTSCQFCK